LVFSFHSVQVHEVAEIFQDLALLVNEQGTQIDNIQANIEAAAVSTTRGVRELTRANKTQQRRRSRMCCLAFIIVIVLILLLTVLHALPGVKM
jgi:syntaxin 7